MSAESLCRKDREFQPLKLSTFLDSRRASAALFVLTGAVVCALPSFASGYAMTLAVRVPDYEVTTFKVTWGLLPKARLRLKSHGNADIQKVNAIAAKATSGGVLVTALITSAATAKRIQSTMKLGTAYLDVDFAVPPRVNMKFVSLKANEKEELPPS